MLQGWLTQVAAFSFLTQIKCIRRNLCSCGPMWIYVAVGRCELKCLIKSGDGRDVVWGWNAIFFNVVALISFRPILEFNLLKRWNSDTVISFTFLQTMLHVFTLTEMSKLSEWDILTHSRGYRQNEFKTKTKK